VDLSPLTRLKGLDYVVLGRGKATDLSQDTLTGSTWSVCVNQMLGQAYAAADIPTPHAR